MRIDEIFLEVFLGGFHRKILREGVTGREALETGMGRQGTRRDTLRSPRYLIIVAILIEMMRMMMTIAIPMKTAMMMKMMVMAMLMKMIKDMMTKSLNKV